MSTPVEMLHNLVHDGMYIRGRVLSDVWLYTDSPFRILRGDVVARVNNASEVTAYYAIEQVLVTSRGYQKFRLAKMPA